ncbi:MAG: FecR family protein [Bdellovibrionia bacterium]
MLKSILFLHLISWLLLSMVCLAQDPAGEVIGIQKSPSVRRSGHGEASLLELGAALFPGDVIQTDDASSAKLLLSDDSVIDVFPSTVFAIGQVAARGPATAELSRGRVRALVTKKLRERARRFEIKTKAAYFGVRGTEFYLSARDVARAETNRHESTVSVLDGSVEVRAGSETVNVGAGQSYTVIAELVAETVKAQPLRASQILTLSAQQETRLREDRLTSSAVLSSSILHTARVAGSLLPADSGAIAAPGDDLFKSNGMNSLLFGPGTNYVTITVGFPP